MENIVIKLVVEGDTKKAKKELENLTEEEKRVKKGFDDVKKAADGAGDEMQKAGKKGKDAFKNTSKGIDLLNSQLSSLQNTIIGVFSVQAIVGFTKEVISTTAEFDKFNAVLTNSLGSSEGAELAMKRIQEIAAKTPFSVKELTDSYVQLVNRGVEPTNKQLVNLADVAAATGKPVDLLLGAIVDATDIMRWRNLGISVENHGKKMIGSFRGLKVEVDANTKGALEMISAFGELNGVAGATESVSKTLAGQISNLGDSWDRMLVAIGTKTKTIFSNTFSLISDVLTNYTKDLEATNELTELFGVTNERWVAILAPVITALTDVRIKTQESAQSTNDYNDAIKRVSNEKQFYIQQNKELIAAGRAESSQVESNNAIIRVYNSYIVKLAKDKQDYINKTEKQREAERLAAEEMRKANEEALRKKGAYAILNEEIGAYNKKLLDQLVLTGKINKENARRVQILERQKKTVDDQLAAYKGKSVAMPSKDLVTPFQKKLQKDLEETKKANQQVTESTQQLIKTEEDYQELIKKRSQILVESINLAGTLSNLYFEQQLSQISQERDARLKVIEEEKNAKINQAGITAKKRAEYEKQFEQEKRTLLEATFEQEKKYKKQQAIINGALAITNVLTQPDPTGGILTAIRVSGAIASTAAQLAVIDAQKFEKGGWIGGKRHREGGTLIEAEKDEFVVNRTDAQKNKGLLDMLNKGMSEQYIQQKYVLPAILNKSLSQINQQGLAENIANSLKYQMYDDMYLRKTFKQASKESAEYIVQGLRNTNRPSRYV